VAELTEFEKEEIVTLLARFKRHAEVVEAMREAHELELTVQQIRTYDPTHGRCVASQKLRSLFEEQRKAYIEDVSKVPAANQGFRLNELNDLYERAKKAKNLKLAAELMEQISKEVGGIFTNVRDLNLNDGRGRARDLSPEERRELLAGKMADALAAPQPQPNAPGTPTAQ
jgi:hypothetical protein